MLWVPNLSLGSSGTYRFTINHGACNSFEADDERQHWETLHYIYKNRPISWGNTGMPAGWDFIVGDKIPQSTSQAAEQVGKGMYVDISLQKNDYLIFVVDDRQGRFKKNRGRVTFLITVLNKGYESSI